MSLAHNKIEQAAGAIATPTQGVIPALSSVFHVVALCIGALRALDSEHDALDRRLAALEARR